MIQVAIPVRIFTVNYRIARGRPYSRLEQRILESIAASGGDGMTLGALRQVFRVHQRLLVEAVVTLVGAGWVAVTSGSEATFGITEDGLRACEVEKDPATVTVVPAPPASIVVDCTRGQLARISDARISSRKHGVPKVWTPIRVERASLDNAVVQKLLPRRTGEWVRSIGPTRLGSADKFVIADVDLEQGIVAGLPRGWLNALKRDIIEVAYDYADELGEITTSMVDGDRDRIDVRPLGVPTVTDRRTAIAETMARITQAASDGKSTRDVRPEAVDRRLRVTVHEALHGPDAHWRALVDVVHQARRNVFMHVPSLGMNGLQQVTDLIEPAVRAGVRFDVVFGALEEGLTTAEVVALLNRVGYEAASNNGRSLLRTASQPTGNTGSLVLYDRGAEHESIIGNHRWTQDAEIDSMSVRFGGQAFIGEVARVAASMWIAGGDAASADRWWRVAEQCADDAAMAEARGDLGNSQEQHAELVIDDEHLGRGMVGETFGSHGVDQLTGAVRGLSIMLEPRWLPLPVKDH